MQQRAEQIRKGARGAPHLYDLEGDPEEKVNVALDHADVVAAMQERLRKRFGA